MVPEAMRAAWILKREYGYETRVLNLHTLKPIDAEAVVRAARETGVVDHRRGAPDRRSGRPREPDPRREPRALWRRSSPAPSA